MKKIIISLALIAMTFTAPAQFISGPASGPALVISGNYRVNGILTSNAPVATVYNIPIGKNGVGFFVHSGGTNSVTTTNSTVLLEQSVNGTDWHNGTFTFSFPVGAGGSAPALFYTNIQPTVANLGNARFLRVKSIQNTNLAGIFITNFLWSTKE